MGTEIKMELWQDMRWPLRILATGVSALVVIKLFIYALGSGGVITPAAKPDVGWAQIVVGALVFVVALVIIFFLWWLTNRFFSLIEADKFNKPDLTSIKELPMGLPEGTIRAVLALIVAMVGLPLLLFQNLLEIDAAIGGYINGIVAGVFGFYFGTRTSGVPAQAVDKIVGAQQIAIQKTAEAAEAKVEASAVKQDADAATTELKRTQKAVGFDATLSKVSQHLEMASTVLGVLGPLLPKDTIPAGAAGIVAQAQKTVAALNGVSAATATDDQLDQLAKVADTLTGDSSPVGAVLRAAAPLLKNVLPIPGLGEVGALAALLSLGTKLGSAQYQRWKARVLGAPLSQSLVEFGALTPELMHAAVQKAPNLRVALSARDVDEIDTTLVNLVTSSDKVNQLLAAYGPNGSIAPGLITDQAHAEVCMRELDQALLAQFSSDDIQAPVAEQVASSLQGSVHADASGDAQLAIKDLTPANLGLLVDSVAGLSAREDLPEAQRAAFDGLIMLVDTARKNNVDLAAVLGGIRS